MEKGTEADNFSASLKWNVDPIHFRGFKGNENSGCHTGQMWSEELLQCK